MELKLWHTIVSACGDVRQMLDGQAHSLVPGAAASAATIIVSQAVNVQGSLRSEIRAKLDELRSELAKVLSEREVYFVLFPLTIHYDELVLRRLPPSEQTAWPLLQSERFGIDDGGDKFYSFSDERLANPDTPPLVFEVLYFCLSDGFIGRYANDPARIDGYKSNLAARIPTPRTPAQNAARRARHHDLLPPPLLAKNAPSKNSPRGRDPSTKKPVRPAEQKPPPPGRLFLVLFYAGAAAVVLLMPLLLVWLSIL